MMVPPERVPLESVDEGLGVMDARGPGEGRDDGDALVVEEVLARAGFGGKLWMACTLAVLIWSLTIFRGRSSKLGVRSGAGRLGGFIAPPRTIFGAADLGAAGLGAGGGVGFAMFAAADAEEDEAFENDSLIGIAGLGGGTTFRRGFEGFVRNFLVFVK